MEEAFAVLSLEDIEVIKYRGESHELFTYCFLRNFVSRQRHLIASFGGADHHKAFTVSNLMPVDTENSGHQTQDEIVRHVVTALEERFLDPSMIEQQRAEIVAENRRTTQPGKRMKLPRQLGRLDAKLSKAKRRLLEVDTDMVSVVQQRIRDLQQKQEQLKQELSQTSVSKQRRVSEANRKLDAALALFSKLRHSLVRSDFKTLRQCLEKTIAKLAVRSGCTTASG